ncbi:hypothetical protein [Streptomyces rochei]|uniref:hypothetical protein n=1 Tax=Streptomyces rochei TaxID=1928 RepID=UPI0036421D0C
MTVTFEALPTSSSARGAHQAIATQLRARPGQWAHVLTPPASGTATSMAYVIRAAKLTAYAPAGTFEAHARTVNGEHRVYARYVGDQAPSPEEQLAEVLRIVAETVTEANDVGGVDINDLVTRLAQAGHQLPDVDS